MNPRLKWLKRQIMTLVITEATGLWPILPRGPARCGPPRRTKTQPAVSMGGAQPTARPPPGARNRVQPTALPEAGRSPASLLLILLEKEKKKREREKRDTERSPAPSASYWPRLRMRHARTDQW